MVRNSVLKYDDELRWPAPRSGTVWSFGRVVKSRLLSLYLICPIRMRTEMGPIGPCHRLAIYGLKMDRTSGQISRFPSAKGSDISQFRDRFPSAYGSDISGITGSYLVHVHQIQLNRTPQRQSHDLPLPKPRKELVRSRLSRIRGRSHGDEPRGDGVGVRRAVGEDCYRCFICWELVGPVCGSRAISGGGRKQGGGQARRASQPMDGRTTA